MGSDGGGERVKTENVQQPPQIAPEAKEGFTNAQNFFKTVLQTPPIYRGERLAPVNDTQRESLAQQRAIFSDPSLGAANYSNLGHTAAGDYLNGPEAQEAVRSLSAPIFQDFNSRVLPGIRDEAQFAGQGFDATRRGVAEQNALENLAGDLATRAYAPVFTGERERMIQASSLIPQAYAGEGLRTGALGATGAAERGFSQEALDLAQAIFEEPLFRRSEAGSALLGSGVFGPGSSSGSSQLTRQLSTMQQIQQYVQLAQGLVSIAGSVAGFASTRELKEDVVNLGADMRDMLAQSILSVPVSTWRYNWEPSSATHVGPMLEDLPEMVRDPRNPKRLDVASMFGALIVTVQQLNARIAELEERVNALPATRN